MNKQSTNKYLAIGNLFTFVYLGVGHFVKLPDFATGFCVGIAIACYLVGFYALKHDISKLQNLKNDLIYRFIR